MDLQQQIAAHMPVDRCGPFDWEPSELTAGRIYKALELTMAQVSAMSGARASVTHSFAGVVAVADAAGLTMEAFGQMFDQALRETL